MSTTVDNRVVSMKFDNTNFEKNVSATMNTLDKFNNKLKFDGAIKGVENVNAAAKRIDLSGMSNAAQTVQAKFSALEVAGITVMANLTNSALNMGKQLISSFTLDPISTGFSEYETKMNAIQTIMSNTANKGTKMADVTAVLDELNTYADKTIYNFAEMTRNVGTFTAAGVGLKESASAIQGIANLAATSGSNAQQASSAMYQLSQALASGTVKLMDWNSVVNAGMGGEKFQEALKATAREHGIAVDDMIKANGSFRDSLEKGWLTADVLNETLNKFTVDGAKKYAQSMMESGKYTQEEADALISEAQNMDDAATKVKTFTQLMDTLKEATQSGWAKTWEILFGNFTEAKNLFTDLSNTFGGLIQASADARNKTLQDWQDLGGRDSAIQILNNSLNSLLSIIAPIKNAFRDIFPAITGEQLTTITKKLEEFTAHLTMSDENANNLRNTFKGLFAVLDLGKQAIGAVFGALNPLTTYIGTSSNGILKFTGTIGNFLTGLDKAADKTEFFKNTIQNLTSGFGDAISRNSSNISKLKDSLNELKDRLEPLSEAFETVRSVISNCLDGISASIKSNDAATIFIGGLTKIATLMVTVANGIIKITGKIGSSLAKAFSLDNMGDAMSLFNGGLFAAILFGLKKFIDGLSGPIGILKGTTDSFNGILNGVKDCLKAYQAQLKANVLIKIGVAIALLAGSLLILSSIDPDRLSASLFAMTILIGELFGALAIFEKIMKGDGFNSIGKVSRAMVLMSTSVLILAYALNEIAKLDWNQLSKGLIGVGVLMGELVAASVILSKNSSSMVKGSVGLILFAEAIKILCGAVSFIARLDVDELTKGLVGVGVLLTELAIFMNATDFDGMGAMKGVGLLALAAGINVLADAVTKFSLLDVAGLTKGLVAVGIVLTEISLFTNLTGNASKVISTAVALTIISAAILILADAIGIMGGMSIEQIAKGLGTMAGALIIIGTALAFMPKSTVLIGSGLVAVATSMVILSKALNKMGGMSWEEISKGLVTLAASLTIIAVAMKFMKGTLGGAAALLVVSSSLSVLTPVLIALGNMSWESIAKGLIAIAGSFTIIGIAGVILGSITPAILALAGAITLIGVAVLAAGVGITLFSTGISALAIGLTALAGAFTISGAEIVAGLTIIMMGIANLIPMIIVQIGNGLIALCGVIAQGAPSIATAGVAVILALIDALTQTMPALTGCILLLLTTLLQQLADSVPKMVEAGMRLVVGILTGVAEHIQEVVETGILIIVNFIKGVTEMLPDVIDAGFKLIISFINGLADGIRENKDDLIDAIINLFSAIVEAALSVLYNAPALLLEAGKALIQSGLIQGIIDVGGDVISTVSGIIGDAVDGIGDFVEDFADAGINCIKGFIKGVGGLAGAAAGAVKDVASGAVDSIRGFLGIHSPSKVFGEIGKYSVLGLAEGLNKFANKAASAATGVGKVTLSAMEDTMSNLSNVIDKAGTSDMTPKIRPVLDLSNIQNGTKQLNSLMASKEALDFSVNYNDSKTQSAIDYLTAAVNKLTSVNDNKDLKVVNALSKLHGAMVDVKDQLSNQQIVMDTGELVGAVVSPIDTALGQISTYKGRGN